MRLPVEGVLGVERGEEEGQQPRQQRRALGPHQLGRLREEAVGVLLELGQPQLEALERELRALGQHLRRVKVRVRARVRVRVRVTVTVTVTVTVRLSLSLSLTLTGRRARRAARGV